MANTLVYPTGVRNFSSAINVQKAAPSFEMLYDASTTFTDAAGRIQTGGWRAATPADFAANVSLSGASVSIDAVAITGNPQVTVSNNPYQVGITGQPIHVTGNFGSSSVAITGNPFVRLSGGFVAITGAPVVTITGVVPIDITNSSLNVAMTGGTFILSGSIDTTNPLGVTGTYRDLASGYSGIDPTQRFVAVGGRAVDTVTGFNPNYVTGNPVTFNFDTRNGGLLVQQTDLDYSVDSVTAYYSNSSTISNTTPSGAHPTGINMVTGTILAANTGRKSWFVQNLSTTSPLYVKFGTGPVGTGAFNFVLNPSAAADQGGGSWSDDQPKWIGDVSISGNGRFISWEL